MDSSSPTPELTPSRSPSPAPPVQPDHFYGLEGTPEPRSPDSSGRTWLDPADDPFATRGIPVFKPTIDEFVDFEGYVSKIECWGMRSGIVKIIPPQEWRDALPPLNPQLQHARIKSPIEQHMLGRSGLFRQSNVEKRKDMSVREWTELCAKEEFRAPSVDDLGLRHAPSGRPPLGRGRTKRGATAKKEPAVVEPDERLSIKQEPDLDDDTASVQLEVDAVNSPPSSSKTPPDTSIAALTPKSSPKKSPTKKSAAKKGSEESDRPDEEDAMATKEDEDVKPKKKRVFPTREEREERLAERNQKDIAFLETFKPHNDWLPPNTNSDDYTPETCQKLERRYWRNQGLGPPAWYGADCAGSLFTDEVKAWNVAHLPSVLSRLLPAEGKGLPGVNTPYLYFGMWRATFAWHVEDMDLFSINYIHFGAGKFWYACPQERASALEHAMKSYFPRDISKCPQFLRHKSFLASPKLLTESACRPNTLVQHAGEFVITFPHGYHAGFNLGLNCAESVNFALESWLDLGRKAKVCECVGDSVRIDVDQLLRQRDEYDASPESASPPTSSSKSKDGTAKKPKSPRKRKSEADAEPHGKKAKKARTSAASSSIAHPAPVQQVKVTLKLPKEPDTLPCCLCVSRVEEDLLPLHEPPHGGTIPGGAKRWMAHHECASVVPETWVDEVEVTSLDPETGMEEVVKETVVFGVDGIPRDRWNLKCNACTKPRNRAHGAPVQCTKGKCPKAYHVSCAKASEDIVFEVLREVEKEVILVNPVVAEEMEQEQGDNMDVDRPDAQTAQMLNQTYADGVDAEVAGPSTVDVMNGVQPSVVANDVEHPGSSAVDPAPAALPLETAHPSNIQSIKIIRKTEVQVLCPQHNPMRVEAKKANKLDKLRTTLLSLPEGSRIKIRVSAGVFEVSLVRVVDETNSVEVLWDRGIKREFKWSSVVFGNTEGITVGQKPSEPAPEYQNPSGGPNTVSYPATALAFPMPFTTQPSTSSTQPKPIAFPAYRAPTGVFSYGSTSWPQDDQYQRSAAAAARQGTTQYGPTFMPYGGVFAGYAAYPQHASAGAGASTGKLVPAAPWHHYVPTAPATATATATYARGQYYRNANQQPIATQNGKKNDQTAASTPSSSSEPISQPPLTAAPATTSTSAAAPTTTDATFGDQTASASTPAPAAPQQQQPHQHEQQQQQQMPTMSDLSALANLQPGQLDEILRGNPSLRDALLGLIAQHNAQQQQQ